MPSSPKHHDYILAQWPDDLNTNTTTLATPYLCCTCHKPCKSITSLRTHKCRGARKKETVA